MRRYRNGKLLIKPSTAAVRRVRERLAAEMRALRGGNAMAVIARLNPVIRGWAAYYRGVVSMQDVRLAGRLPVEAHLQVGHAAPQRTSRSAGSSAGTSASSTSSGTTAGCSATATAARYLVKFSWTHPAARAGHRARHPPMTPPWPATGPNGGKKVKPPLDSYTLRLLTRQDGRCPLCGDHLLNADQPPQSPEQWERWWLHVTRKAIAASYLTHHGQTRPAADDQTRLVHASCQRELQARQRRKPEHQLQPATPSRLA